MTSALLIIDMQAEMMRRIQAGRDHVNGDANAKITRLAHHCREQGLPVLHVRHSEATPGGTFHPAASSAAPLPCDMARGGEMVFRKSGSSAFSGTQLKAYLDSEGIDHLIICGAVTGFCIASTVRAASDFGFHVTLIEDAVLGFDLPARGLSARQVHEVTIALLAEDFATLARSDTLPQGKALTEKP